MWLQLLLMSKYHSLRSDLEFLGILRTMYCSSSRLFRSHHSSSVAPVTIRIILNIEKRKTSEKTRNAKSLRMKWETIEKCQLSNFYNVSLFRR